MGAEPNPAVLARSGTIILGPFSLPRSGRLLNGWGFETALR